jgi:hypothetical protein
MTYYREVIILLRPMTSYASVNISAGTFYVAVEVHGMSLRHMATWWGKKNLPVESYYWEVITLLRPVTSYASVNISVRTFYVAVVISEVHGTALRHMATRMAL